MGRSLAEEKWRKVENGREKSENAGKKTGSSNVWFAVVEDVEERKKKEWK